MSLRDDLFSNPTSGGTRAEENDFLLAKLTAGSAAGGDQRTDGHGCGALNIIVKGANLITIARQQRHCVFLREIFEL